MRIQPVLLPLLAAALTACSVLSPQDDPTRYYVIDGTTPDRIKSLPQLGIQIGPVSIPGYLDRDEIVTRGENNELHIAPFALWAEPLDEAVVRVLAEELSHLLGTPTVGAYPGLGRESEGYQISLILRRFEKGADGKVHLDVGYVLKPTSGGDPETGSRSLTIPVAAPGDFNAVAKAMSEALGELAKALAKKLG